MLDTGFFFNFKTSSAPLLEFPLGSNFGVEFLSRSSSEKLNRLSPTTGCRHFEIKTTKTRPKTKFLTEVFNKPSVSFVSSGFRSVSFGFRKDNFF
jgi:hypothetical protein